jgi:hypothetical protein
MTGWFPSPPEADPEYEPGPVSEPTDARPGTTAKIELLRERLAAGMELWHEHDSTLKDEDRLPTKPEMFGRKKHGGRPIDTRRKRTPDS